MRAAFSGICNSFLYVVTSEDIDKSYTMYIQSICRLSRWRGTGLAKKEAKGSKKKNSQLILRLDKEERDEFVELCKELDTSAAREIRRFIRDFMAENRAD